MDSATLEYIKEKAEIYATLTVKEKEQFLNRMPAKYRHYKDRLVAEAMKLSNYPSQLPNPSNTDKTMALHPLKNDEIEEYAKTAATMTDGERENYLKTQVHGLSRKKVADRAAEIFKDNHNALVEKQRESKNLSNNSNKMADKATRRKPVELDPENNKAHKVLSGVGLLHAAAKQTDFAGFDDKNLKEDKQKLSKEEKMAIYERQFQSFRRKFIEVPGKKLPLADPENPLHPKAIAVIREMIAERKDKGGKYVAEHAEEWLNKIEAVYATEKKGGTGRKKATFDLEGDWSF